MMSVVLLGALYFHGVTLIVSPPHMRTLAVDECWSQVKREGALQLRQRSRAANRHLFGWAAGQSEAVSHLAVTSGCHGVRIALSTNAGRPLNAVLIKTTSSQIYIYLFYIIVMYSRTCPGTSVEDARKLMFGQGSHTIENIPPTKAALILQHVKRAVYEAGHVWSQVLVPAPHLPSSKLWAVLQLIQAELNFLKLCDRAIKMKWSRL